MDSYTPEEPSTWRRYRARQSVTLPVVYIQNTDLNQAICSLMSAVLLRKIQRDCSGSTARLTTRREPLTSAFDGRKVFLDWYFVDDAMNSSTESTPPASINVPVVLILHGTSPKSRSVANGVANAVRNHGWITAALFDMIDEGEAQSVETTSFAVHYVASRLASGTPLFLVGDGMCKDSILHFLASDTLLDSLCSTIFGFILISVARPEECKTDHNIMCPRHSDSRASNVHQVAHIDVPRLILDLDSTSDTNVKEWRNDPNAIVVQMEGRQPSSADVMEDGGGAWVARSVVCFADSVIRLRGSGTDASRKVQGARGLSNIQSRL